MVEKLSLDWLEDDKTVNSLEVIGMAIDYHFDRLDTEIVPIAQILVFRNKMWVLNIHLPMNFWVKNL